ncbi:MAG: hypothetical protein GQ574_19605 [Crocinitomix sp.]|nr:hypothetical protein [Crocinitomix sp.]
MGTLHIVYQLKPKVISKAAILCVRKEMQSAFLEKFRPNKSKDKNEWGIFSNTAGIISNDGKVERYSMYSTDRIIDFKVSGVYISIQSGSKYGFGEDFVTLIENFSPYLENTLFFVTWDYIIRRFEIKDGEFSFQLTKDFDQWDYSSDEYVDSNYIQSPQIIADFYVDRIIE